MEYCSAVRVKDKGFMGKSKRTNSIRSRKNDNKGYKEGEKKFWHCRKFILCSGVSHHKLQYSYNRCVSKETDRR